jgi:putative membrane protein
VESEDIPAARLEAEVALADPPPARRWSMPALVTAGMSTLILGFAGLQTIAFVEAEYVASPILGGVASAIALAGFGLVGLGFWRELSALAALRSVDRLRAALAGNDAVARAKAARAWVSHLPEGPALLPAINAINDPDAILALLRSGPAATLRVSADALGRSAAYQSVAGIAAMPSAGLAALFVAWRGLRLVRQVASLYGMRPGLFATLSLVKRTVLAAGAVAGVEVAANTAAHALLSNVVMQHLAGEMAGAGVAARRMMVLARAASVACSPLPPE